LDGFRVKDIRTFSKAVVVLSHEGYKETNSEIAKQLVEIVRLRGQYDKLDQWYPTLDTVVRTYQAFNGVVTPTDVIAFLRSAGPKAAKSLSNEGFKMMLIAIKEKKQQGDDGRHVLIDTRPQTRIKQVMCLEDCKTMPSTAFMLDTNVFNAVIDNKISLTAFKGRRLLVIGVQMAEAATKNAARRDALLAIAEEIKPTSVLASSFAFGIEGAGFDQACWNDGSGAFQKCLIGSGCSIKKKKKKGVDDLNPDRDILIAEAAIKNKAILVSNDNNLRQVVLEFMGTAITLTKFLEDNHGLNLP
jgi:rRNA-processing protein FCF1